MSILQNLIIITWDGKSKPLECVYFDKKPNFEILIFNITGENKDCEISDLEYEHYISHRTENKGQIFHFVYEYLITRNLLYNYIGIIDDDIIFKISEFEYMLHIAELHKLDVFQPSIAKDSFFSHRKFVNRSGVMVAFTDWIEIMAPFYRQEIFISCKDYFLKTISGQGIDCYLMPVIQKINDKNRTAIIHAITIKHHRPIRSHKRVYSNGLNNEEEIELIRKEALKIAKDSKYSNLFNLNFIRLRLNEGNKFFIKISIKLHKFNSLIKNLSTFIKELANF